MLPKTTRATTKVRGTFRLNEVASERPVSFTQSRRKQAKFSCLVVLGCIHLEANESSPPVAALFASKMCFGKGRKLPN